MHEMVPRRPILRKEKAPEERQCLKHPQYKCICSMSDLNIRRTRLRELRQKLGAYSFINLLDEGVAKNYERERHQLCEGRIPTLSERVKSFFSRK